MAAADPSSFGPAIMFCPGDRPDRFGKALAAADQVILDLEDAVALDHKDHARREVGAALPDLDPDRIIVRVNPLDTDRGQADLEAITGSGVRLVMAPKSEPGVSLPEGFDWIALCETPRGVLGIEKLAATEGVAAITWGSEDLAVALGARLAPGVDPMALPHLLQVRGTTALAAAACGIAALDRVYLDLEDQEGLRREALEAVAMGYHAKLALHPRQAATIRAAFLPSEEEAAAARGVLEAAEAAGGRAFSHEGQMVDEPLIRQARLVVDLAERGAR